MAARQSAFLKYLDAPRQRLPSEGLRCPPELVAQLGANSLCLALDTVTDGNCGIHAFLISLEEAAKRYSVIKRSHVYKKLQTKRASGDLANGLKHLRSEAMTWIFSHSSDVMWEGMTVKDLALSMATFPGTFVEYIEDMRIDKKWVDCMVIHSLACLFGVDVDVWQTGMDGTLLGTSLHKDPGATFIPLLTIAMVNDLHYWGVRGSIQPQNPSFLGHDPADNGEWMRSAASKEDSSDAEGPGDALASVDIGPPPMPPAEMEAEFALCNCLGRWNPWVSPEPSMVEALQKLGETCGDRATGAARCMLRAQVVEDLLYEAKHEATLPESFRYHRAARYRLRSCAVSLKGSSGKRRFDSVTEGLETRLALKSDLQKELAEPCSRGKTDHACLVAFRQQPQLVKNWRLLWRSLSAASRREALLTMFQISLAAHRALSTSQPWTMKFTVLGVYVCEAAFQRLTGVGSWALTKARSAALDGHASSLSRSELGYTQLVRNTNKQNVYLDARQWLERYADSHAEQSSISGRMELPSGRKGFYYCAYYEDRKSVKMTAASPSIFLEAWRQELPVVTVQASVCKFTKCGLCMYLKRQCDVTPRSQPQLLEVYKRRLGQHFNFQSAQRLAEDRIEEVCRMSEGKKWIMHIDKMDQHTTEVPQVWSLAATPLMKLGSRLVAGIIGSMWSGPRDTSYLCRTVFEDTQHGADMQCSAVLLNLWDVARREHHLPEEFYIGADNTVKETKNTYMVWFMIWLLCVLAGTPLWSTSAVFLLVGHTHNRLDRFFSRLSVALRGHDFYHLNGMWSIIQRVLSETYDIKIAHLNTVWEWTKLEQTNEFPRLKRLHNVHHLNVYRDRDGIQCRWKQYMTDDAWSNPVLLLPQNRTADIQGPLLLVLFLW